MPSTSVTTTTMNNARVYAESIVETIQEPLVILDRDLHVVSINPAFSTAFKLKREDAVNINFFDMGNRHWDIPAIRESLEKIVTGNSILTDLEVHHAFPGAGEKVLQISGKKIETGPETQPFILLSIRDVTAQKKKEDDIQRYNILLQDRNKELDAFNYSISHDLKSPLRAIDGFSQILIEDYAGKLDAEGQRLLNIVRNNTKRMEQLITDLLMLSRTTRRDVQHTLINMTELVHAIAEHAVSGVAERKIVTTILPLPSAQGDLPMITQVWTNLIGNAVKFTAQRATPHIETGGTTEGNEHRYYVKDDGAGFDMKYVDKLFGIFQRLHTEEEFPGTGVGLAIVKRIINRHGGRLWAEGKVNEGAAFFFTLPVIPLAK